MGNQKPANFALQYLTLDYIQGLPRSRKGNTELLVVNDVFSKFVWTDPQRKLSSEKVCEFLEKRIFLIFGVPQFCHTDNSTVFRGRTFNGFMEEWGVQHIYSPSHCSRPNNTERSNRVIEELLRAALIDEQNQRNWDEHSDRIACALRISRHDATREIPHEVVFGRTFVLNGRQYESENILNPREDDVAVKAIHMQKIWDDVQDRLEVAHQVAKERYDNQANPRRFYVGQIVWKREFPILNLAAGFNAKLSPRYRKVRVRSITGSNTYEVEDLEGRSLGVFHLEHLKD